LALPLTGCYAVVARLALVAGAVAAGGGWWTPSPAVKPRRATESRRGLFRGNRAGVPSLVRER